MRRFGQWAMYGLVILWGIGVMVPAWPVTAQDNLLQNSSFSDAFAGQGGIAGAVPTGWVAWGSFQDSDQETLAVLYRSAPRSWRLRAEFAQPTGGGYQTASVERGASYRFSIYAQIWTCDDEEWQCRDDSHTFSDPSSNARVRVGIDPTGGMNPYGGSVQWGGTASPLNWGSFSYLSVDATAQSSQITVFTQFIADKPMRFNDLFWDDAALVKTSDSSSGSSGSTGSMGSTGSTSSTGSTGNTAVATTAPVVADAQERPDGAQVHIVESGQTLWSIAVAYGVSLDDLRAWNDLTGSVIRIGQVIIVKPAPQTASQTTSQRTSQTVPQAIPQATAPPAAGSAGAEASENDDDSTRMLVGIVAAVVVGGAVIGGGAIVVMAVVLYRRGLI